MSSLVYRIHGTVPGGFEDSVLIRAETLEELVEKAKQETKMRGWVQLWSEAVEDNSDE
jgi:hypothetical protein